MVRLYLVVSTNQLFHGLESQTDKQPQDSDIDKNSGDALDGVTAAQSPNKLFLFLFSRRAEDN